MLTAGSSAALEHAANTPFVWYILFLYILTYGKVFFKSNFNNLPIVYIYARDAYSSSLISINPPCLKP